MRDCFRNLTRLSDCAGMLHLQGDDVGHAFAVINNLMGEGLADIGERRGKSTRQFR